MVLNARVVSIESAEKFVDGLKRVTLRFDDADALYHDIRLPLTDKVFKPCEPQLDDVLVFEYGGKRAD